MAVNCIASAAYVCRFTKGPLFLLKEYPGALHAQADQSDRIQGLGFDVLQQLPLHTRPGRFLPARRELGSGKFRPKLVRAHVCETA